MKLAKRTDSASRIDRDWRPHAGGCMRVENMGSWVRDCGLTLLCCSLCRGRSGTSGDRLRRIQLGAYESRTANADVTEIETGACTACRNGTVSERTTMATKQIYTTPYWTTTATFSQFAKLDEDLVTDFMVRKNSSRWFQPVVMNRSSILLWDSTRSSYRTLRGW